MFGGKLDVGAPEMILGEATHCLVSALDGKRIQFGIGILTNESVTIRYFLTVTF